MEIDRALSFIRENHHAVMTTRRSDGSPQMSPVAAGVDGSGRVIVSSRETAMKTKNVRRDPHVSLCVFTDRFFGEWLQVDGTVEVVSLPEAMDHLVEYYRNAVGEHPDWDEYRQAMETEKRVALLVEVTRAGPDRSG